MSGNRTAAATRPRIEWTVATWRDDQGVEHYDAMNLEWKTMMLRRGEDGGPVTDERGNKLFAMVLYDLDQFRKFVFKSRFLQLFVVDEDVLEKIWDDDEELLKFGYQYIKTVLKIEEEALKLQEVKGTEATTMTF